MPELSTKGYNEVPGRSSKAHRLQGLHGEESSLRLFGSSMRFCWCPMLGSWLHCSSRGMYIPRNRFPGCRPEFRTTKLFEFETLYGEPLSPEAEKAWDEMMPIGRGFVTIQNDTALPDQPGLNQSLPEQHAMISVFHQLHCIYMTREGYYAAREGNVDQVSAAHLMHCWDYLRQTVMCFADTALEWIPAPPNDKGSTGWGFGHQCHDFDAISDWAEENRLKTTFGIH
ncbi:hypothetical protein BO71DRAFT_480605 [Aspergillus ellipticus CBS 707.79]|uniref:Oxidase ustYa n=1 Tax=Aspergillus ellipticus CBS 707.79 TaxID=1448320 RepID=A0A319EBC9_9EURO|nr:hypothetical protein BO71DRAFT_480605 [Aspergillus ellipticus CBS 707.79]